MEIKVFKINLDEVGGEEKVEIPEPQKDLNLEKYDKLRMWGWSDDDIQRMIDRKTKGVISDSGVVHVAS